MCVFSDVNDIDPAFGYHRVCYSRFTDKTKVERAIARKERLAKTHIQDVQMQEEAEAIPSTPSPKKRLRSHHASAAVSQAAARSSNILPRICIICRKENLREGPRSKRVTAKLM